jgi:hypothetical protein
MRLTAAGNVGIGTTAPSEKLHVVGDIVVVGDDGWNGAGDMAKLIFGSNIGTNAVGVGYEFSGGLVFDVWKSGSTGKFGSNTLDAMYIEEITGNVGIGTASPAAKLHVVGSTMLFDTSEAGTARIKLGSSNARGKISLYEMFDGTNATEEFRIYDDGSWNIGSLTTRKLNLIANGNKYVTVDYVNGNVGIWTTSPGAKLDVAGSGFVTGPLRVGASAGAGYMLDVVSIQPQLLTLRVLRMHTLTSPMGLAQSICRLVTLRI